MNEPTSIRTPEQIAQIKRLAPPIAIAAVVMAIAGLALLTITRIDHAHPPSIVGINLCFCAMMMGIGIVLWAKGSGAVQWALRICLAAVLLGAVGPFVFFKQGIDLRKAMEERELGNVAAIARAAQAYARDFGGDYPSDLSVLLEKKYLEPAGLISPYMATPPLTVDVAALRAKYAPKDVLKEIDAHSDYEFDGAGLAAPPKATHPLTQDILVASAKLPVMRIDLAVAFADGTSRFITLEEAERILLANDTAREHAGQPAMAVPDAIKRARSLEHPASPGSQP